MKEYAIKVEILNGMLKDPPASGVGGMVHRTYETVIVKAKSGQEAIMKVRNVSAYAVNVVDIHAI